jgi:hypothetical protein
MLRLLEEVDLGVRQLEGSVDDLLDIVSTSRAPNGRPARRLQSSGGQHPGIDDLPEGICPGSTALLAVEVFGHGSPNHANAVTVLPHPTPGRLHNKFTVGHSYFVGPFVSRLALSSITADLPGLTQGGAPLHTLSRGQRIVWR